MHLVDSFNQQAVPARSEHTPGSETALKYQPSGTHQISRIEIWTGKLDAKKVDIYFGVREDALGKPGSRLAPEQQVSIESSEEGWHAVSFAKPIAVTQECIYWITYAGVIEGGPAVSTIQKPDGTLEAIRIPAPGRTYRAPEALPEPQINPDLQQTTYFWSYDGVDWRGPYTGHHMIRIYAES